MKDREVRLPGARQSKILPPQRSPQSPRPPRLGERPPRTPGRQDEHPAEAQDASGFRDRAMRVGEREGPPVGEGDVERSVPEGQPFRVASDQRERGPPRPLDLQGLEKPGTREIDADGPGPSLSEGGRPVGGPAAELEHVAAPDGSEQAEFSLRNPIEPPGHRASARDRSGVAAFVGSAHAVPRSAVPSEVDRIATPSLGWTRERPPSLHRLTPFRSGRAFGELVQSNRSSAYSVALPTSGVRSRMPTGAVS